MIVRHLDRVDLLEVKEKENKGRPDLVSEVDRRAEARIIDTIRGAYPEHSILAEESGHHPGSEVEWVVDPLDGTRNYLRGLPHFAVSIAVRRRGVLEHGVVFDPVRQELFAASRGAGANLDSRRIRVTTRRSLRGAMLGTALPSHHTSAVNSHLSELRALNLGNADMRRSGSCALDLAYVAAGRLDGFWGWGLSPWDIAAGILLVREAGGIVTGRQGADDAMSTGDVVAAGPRTLRVMLPRLRSRRSPDPAEGSR